MNKTLTLCAMGVLACAAGAEAKQPNIIVILTDDMGYSDLGCYGGAIRTPNLDRLAAEGLQYMQFYNTARSCPSRASLLTGLHPHQAGVGHMTDNRGEDGYRGGLNTHCVTFAEVLKPAGYETYAVGKWHVSKDMSKNGPRNNWPMQRGFDHYYGTIQGGGSFFDPASLCRGNEYITVENDPKYNPGKGKFYYTNAIGDNACMFLDEHRKERGDKPFFMYVAFTAAHWPMHIPAEDADMYKGAFDKGWDALRQAKYKDMVKRGIIRPEWALSQDQSVKEWNAVVHKDFEKRCMEVYAAMVTVMDRNVGKIVEELRKNGQLENTVIFYLQDNGGCAEDMERGKEPYLVKIPQGEDLSPMGPDELQTRLVPIKSREGKQMQRGRVMPGPADTYVAYGKAWAYLSNTPFREYKHWVHEGGISTPLIVNWPAGIKARGERRQRPGQLMDIMATCVELSGADYPKTFKGEDIYPCEGKSLASSFAADNSGDGRYLYWEHEGNRAVRTGQWKLVYKAEKGKSRDIEPGDWELYDMSADRTETNNLAAKYPDRVAEMAKKWDEYAVRCHVTPWPK